jgi:hypothetical protein
VGYWPLQETNAPAPGNWETNYGTLGKLGNAYYACTNASGVAFAQPGALAGTMDPCVRLSGSSANPNSYAFVPRLTPALTIQAPFTLEAWVNMANTGFGVDIGEGGGTGLNGGKMVSLRGHVRRRQFDLVCQRAGHFHRDLSQCARHLVAAGHRRRQMGFQSQSHLRYTLVLRVIG